MQKFKNQIFQIENNSYENSLLDGKIDDRRIFVDKKCILSKSFDVQNDKFRQYSDLKSFHKIIFV